MICKSNKSNTPPNCATCVVRGKSIFSSLCDKEIEKISQYIKKKSTYLAGEYLINEHDSEHRSEERRVGKECRSRWSPYH